MRRRTREAHTRVPTYTCPCGRVLNAAAPATGHHQVKPGELSICIGCGALRVFNARLELEPVDLESLTREEQRDVARARAALAAMRPN